MEPGRPVVLLAAVATLHASIIEQRDIVAGKGTKYTIGGLGVNAIGNAIYFLPQAIFIAWRYNSLHHKTR